MRLLDVVDDSGALPLLDSVADGIVNSVTLLAIDRITDLFSLDAIGRPALLLVVDLAFLREVGVEFEGKLKGFCIWVPRRSDCENSEERDAENVISSVFLSKLVQFI